VSQDAARVTVVPLGIVPTSSVQDAEPCTVTENDCSAERPPGSVAVTRIVAVPAATPATATVRPETLTVATLVLDELAVYVSASPSGSLKYDEAFRFSLAPAVTVMAGIVPTACGDRLPPPPPEASPVTSTQSKSDVLFRAPMVFNRMPSTAPIVSSNGLLAGAPNSSAPSATPTCLFRDADLDAPSFTNQTLSTFVNAGRNLLPAACVTLIS